jgi:hypothetical protein
METTPCVQCGRDLWDEDFALGTARRVDDLPLCLPCHLGPPTGLSSGETGRRARGFRARRRAPRGTPSAATS